MFEVNSWEYGKNKKYSLIKKIFTKNSIPVISGVTENNGVNYYTEDVLSEHEVFESELTISTRGIYSGTVFYQDGKFALANNILVMKMPKLSKKQKQFIGSIINSLPYGGYDGYPKKETLKQDKIQLPITAKGEINFAFMEKFIAELEAERIAELEAERIAELEAERIAELEAERIAELEAERIAELEAERIAELEAERIAELEAERIAELEAYLIATGLSDYILSKAEKEVLRVFRENEKAKTGGGGVTLSLSASYRILVRAA